MVSELLPIQLVNNVDVVDSRLIAIELGIQHKNLLETIRKYQDRLEKRGHLAFETETVQNSVGAKNQAVFYWLNERQCIFLTTLSRNTEQVVALKDKIEESFYHAKKLITQQNDRIRELEMQLEISRNQKYILDKSDAIASLHGVQMLALFQGRPDAVVEVKEKVTETMICIEGRTVSFVGKSTAELGKELGFKTGKDFEMWLVRNDAEHLICQGMRAVQAPYIPKENIKEVKRLFSIARNKVQRQMLIGE